MVGSTLIEIKNWWKGLWLPSTSFMNHNSKKWDYLGSRTIRVIDKQETISECVVYFFLHKNGRTRSYACKSNTPYGRYDVKYYINQHPFFLEVINPWLLEGINIWAPIKAPSEFSKAELKKSGHTWCKETKWWKKENESQDNEISIRSIPDSEIGTEV